MSRPEAAGCVPCCGGSGGTGTGSCIPVGGVSTPCNCPNAIVASSNTPMTVLAVANDGKPLSIALADAINAAGPWPLGGDSSLSNCVYWWNSATIDYVCDKWEPTWFGSGNIAFQLVCGNPPIMSYAGAELISGSASEPPLGTNFSGSGELLSYHCGPTTFCAVFKFTTDLAECGPSDVTVHLGNGC